jgi:hypothetical protein
MVVLILSLLGALRSALRTHVDLAIENLALRQQLASLRRTSSRPRLRNSDRAFWLVLSRLWSRWADVLVVVKPDTVVRWHRTGVRPFWRWKSHSGSPSDGGVSQENRRLIRQMAEANVGWGAPRGELLKLGIDISERSASRFLPPKPPSGRGPCPASPGADVLRPSIGAGACRAAETAPRSQHAGTRSPEPGGLPTTSRSTPPGTAGPRGNDFSAVAVAAVRPIRPFYAPRSRL